MANTKNLKPQAHALTVAEASKGGKNSAKARQQRKTLKEELLLLLADGDTQKSISLSLIAKAMSGDTKAFEVIRDTIGEKPVDKVIVADVEPSVIAEVEAMVHDSSAGG